MINNIFLVRHGESEANVNRAIGQTKADHAIELSELGHRQAQAVGLVLANEIIPSIDTTTKDEELRKFMGDRLYEQERINQKSYLPIGLWISPYTRTRQTAYHIQKGLVDKYLRLRVKEHINLVEQQFGLFDGIPDEQLADRYPDEHSHYKRCENHNGRFWARMPLGESRFDVAMRVHQAFGTFRRDAEDNDIRDLIIVAHGVTNRAFVMQWLNLSPEWFESEPNPGNCSVRHIQGGQDKGYIYEGSK